MERIRIPIWRLETVMQSLTGAASPYLGKWEVASSLTRGRTPFYHAVTVRDCSRVEVVLTPTISLIHLFHCGLTTIHEHYRQPDGQTGTWIYCGTDPTQTVG